MTDLGAHCRPRLPDGTRPKTYVALHTHARVSRCVSSASGPGPLEGLAHWSMPVVVPTVDASWSLVIGCLPVPNLRRPMGPFYLFCIFWGRGGAFPCGANCPIFARRCLLELVGQTVRCRCVLIYRACRLSPLVLWGLSRHLNAGSKLNVAVLPDGITFTCTTSSSR